MSDSNEALKNAMALAENDTMMEMQDFLSQYNLSIRCGKKMFAEQLSAKMEETNVKKEENDAKHKKEMLYVTLITYMKGTLKNLQTSCENMDNTDITKYELESLYENLVGKLEDTTKMLTNSPVYLLGDAIDDIKLKTQETDAFTTVQLRLRRSDPFSIVMHQLLSAMHRVIGDWMSIKRITQKNHQKLQCAADDVDMDEKKDNKSDEAAEPAEGSKQPDAKKHKNGDSTKVTTAVAPMPEWMKDEHVLHVIRWNSNSMTTRLISKQIAQTIGKDQLKQRNDFRKETNQQFRNVQGQKGGLDKMLKTDVGTRLSKIAMDKMYKSKPTLKPNTNAKVTLDVPPNGQIDLDDSELSDNTRKRAREPSADHHTTGMKAELTADQILRQYEHNRLKGIAKRQRNDKKGGNGRKGSADSHKGRKDGGKGKPFISYSVQEEANNWSNDWKHEAYTNSAPSGSRYDNSWPKKLGAPPGSIWKEGLDAWEKMRDGNWYCFEGPKCGQTHNTKEDY